jgi:hypothetical protein
VHATDNGGVIARRQARGTADRAGEVIGELAMAARIACEQMTEPALNAVRDTIERACRLQANPAGLVKPRARRDLPAPGRHGRADGSGRRAGRRGQPHPRTHVCRGAGRGRHDHQLASAAPGSPRRRRRRRRGAGDRSPPQGAALHVAARPTACLGPTTLTALPLDTDRCLGECGNRPRRAVQAAPVG